MPKWNRKGNNNSTKTPKGNQKDVKVSQGTSQNARRGTGKVKMRKSIQKGSVSWHEMGTIFDQNRQKYHPRNHQNKYMEFDTKEVPKWTQDRCQKSSKINAKTDNEKDYEHQQKSCFSDV